jgi:hypothetical protein
MSHSSLRLLEPFGITQFYTDAWGAHEYHLNPAKPRVSIYEYRQISQTEVDNALELGCKT